MRTVFELPFLESTRQNPGPTKPTQIPALQQSKKVYMYFGIVHIDHGIASPIGNLWLELIFDIASPS